ncbi:MAG: hypothetical protein DMF26_05685 [Verrucomicrobia bacterium]|nr:MAG: hypothetical protein DMF26_05685 [Verrucomicrobiota bacterium]
MIFYVVVRGGFFSPQTTFENTSPFGFAALAALVGLFSEQAVLKLKKVAETVLEPPAPGEDAKPQEEVAKAVSPKSVPGTQTKPDEKGSSSSPGDTTTAGTILGILVRHDHWAGGNALSTSFIAVSFCTTSSLRCN